MHLMVYWESGVLLRNKSRFFKVLESLFLYSSVPKVFLLQFRLLEVNLTLIFNY